MSPAQVMCIFEAKGWMKKRAGSDQLMALAASMGMPIQKK